MKIRYVVCIMKYVVMITVILYSGAVGLGHTKSLQWSGQNSRILSWRYHCRSSVKPGGTITVGRSAAVGFHDRSLTRVIVLSPNTIYIILDFHLARKLMGEVKMVHLFNALQCCFDGVLIKILTPIICGHNCFTILGSYQLSNIGSR